MRSKCITDSRRIKVFWVFEEEVFNCRRGLCPPRPDKDCFISEDAFLQERRCGLLITYVNKWGVGHVSIFFAGYLVSFVSCGDAGECAKRRLGYRPGTV